MHIIAIVCPQNEVRRSERLQENGYYDEEGTPTISYRERLVSVFKKRRRLNGRASHCSPNNNDIVSQSEMSGNQACAENTGLPMWQRSRSRHSSINIAIQHQDEKCCLRLIGLQLFLVAVLSFGVLALNDARGGLSCLQNKLNKLEHTMHPQAYSLPDFALDAHGAYIIPDLTSKTYSAFPESMEKFKAPCSVIRGQTLPLTPGHCWPLEGESGQLFISLAHDIHITHVSLGHIGKEQSPVGQTLSAPKRFTVYGLNDVKGDETRLGTFEYNNDGDSMQTFEIHDHTDEIFKYVKLVVESNYGNPSYTCLYNFKVHGHIPQ